IPPKENWEAIQEIRKSYDRNINRWMHHITLLYPFRPETQYNVIEEEFIKICNKIKSFNITLNTFRFFSHGRQSYTLWLDPEPNSLIIQLQAEIQKIFPDCNEVNKYKNGFKPHLSIGQIKGKNKILNIINDLQATWEQINFMVDKIFFISREEGKASKFKALKQFELK
ncbi:MAG: 2'-5' RNA ligase family protein, partial [Promethearchaeota archaeon]